MTNETQHKVLIIGGTGVFGKRLVRHLANFNNLDLFVSSRSHAKADAFVQTIKPADARTKITALRLDHTGDWSNVLDDIKPNIVIDCSGPFQSASFEVARQSLEAGAHHIDLADARDYLRHYRTSLNPLATKNKRTGLTGASSTPALSACVVAELTQNWKRVDSIDICITPGGKSEVGQSVIEAIMSYAGKDIPIWRAGKLEQTVGWLGSWKVNMPGLGARRVAPVETIDAEHLGPKLGVRARISFAAGLESSLEQWGIQCLAWFRRRRLLPDLKHLIPVLLKMRRFTRLTTSDQGGMMVVVKGLDDKGAFRHSVWSLLAKQDHGPFVPILPAAAATRRLILNPVPAGANLACELLTLNDIVSELEPYEISTNTKSVACRSGLFQNLMGEDNFERLPTALKNFHCVTAEPVWSGNATIEGSKGLGAQLVARLFGFPVTVQYCPVTVSVERMVLPNGRMDERWTRNFDGQVFSSTLSCDKNGQITETFGPFNFSLAINSDTNGIKIAVHSWRLGRLPLPKFLAPISVASEYEDEEGRFCFDIRLTLPLLGLLAHYKGYLQPHQ